MPLSSLPCRLDRTLIFHVNMVLDIYGVFINLIMGICLCICLSVLIYSESDIQEWTPHFNYEGNMTKQTFIKFFTFFLLKGPPGGSKDLRYFLAHF